VFAEFTGAIFYAYPIFNAIYVYNVHQISKNITGSDVRTWIFVELNYFFVWLASLAIFMIYAYLWKYKSVWKRQFDESSE